MSAPELNSTAEDLLRLFELTPDLVCIAGKDGFFRNFNPAVPKTLGYSREELFSMPIAHFVHPDDRAETGATRAELLKGKTLLNFQNRYITKKGKIVWLEWTSIYLSKRKLVFAIAKNVTVKKELEQEIIAQNHHFRQLAAHLKTNLEHDRKLLAAELHEGIAQLATALKFDVEWIGSLTPGMSAQARERLKHAMVTADMLVDTIRRISFSISPDMLDDLGLDAAIDWYCKEFSVASGMVCSYESDFNEELLSKEIRLDIFRLCQEALSIIKQHHKASTVKLGISEKRSALVFSIQDDGTHRISDGNKDAHILVPLLHRTRSINAECNMDWNAGKGNFWRIEIQKKHLK